MSEGILREFKLEAVKLVKERAWLLRGALPYNKPCYGSDGRAAGSETVKFAGVAGLPQRHHGCPQRARCRLDTTVKAESP